MSDTQSQDQATTTPVAKELGELPFTEYVAARRGKTLPAESETKDEPVADKAAEQKKTEESSPSKDAAKEAEDDESDAEDSEESDAKDDAEKGDKPKKKSGAQRRKERAERAEAEAERARADAEHWKAMALKGAGDSKKDYSDAKPKAAEASGKPSPDSFETYAEYTEALTDWKIEQRENARKEAETRAKFEQEHQTLRKSHVERVNAFKAKTDDFDEAMEELKDVPKSPTLEQVIVSSEYGPQMLYALAQDKAEAMRIAQLGPVAQAKELGKLEAKVSAAAASKAAEATKQEPKKQTQAPKPLEPVGKGKGAVAKSITDPEISFSDYERLRREQMRRRRA